MDERSRTLRYVLKNKVSGQVYFVIVFALLRAEEVEMLDEEDQFGHDHHDVVTTTMTEGNPVANAPTMTTQADMYEPRADDLD